MHAILYSRIRVHSATNIEVCFEYEEFSSCLAFQRNEKKKTSQFFAL